MGIEVIHARQLEDLKFLKVSKDCVEDEHYSLELWFMNTNSLNDKHIYIPMLLHQKLME